MYAFYWTNIITLPVQYNRMGGRVIKYVLVGAISAILILSLSLSSTGDFLNVSVQIVSMIGLAGVSGWVANEVVGALLDWYRLRKQMKDYI